MFADKIIVPAPTIEDRKIVKPLLCGPGPCNLWPSVVEALTKPTLTPFCEEFTRVLDDIRAGIQYLFQTRSKLVFPVGGAGHAGMETVITNLVAPGEDLLIAARGIWDERAHMIAKRHGINVHVLQIHLDQAFTFTQLEESLKKIKPTALFITYGDSSTGSIQKLDGLGKICHKYGTLLLVDTVVVIAGAPFFMDEWQVDGVFASTQKALSGPAGISPVAFSALAEKKIHSNKHKPPFYFDAKLQADQWCCYDTTPIYHHTLSAPLIWALRSCLQELTYETLPVCWARHAATTAHFHKRLQEYGFEFLIRKPEDRLVTVTTVLLPKGIDHDDFINHMRAKYNIVIFPGCGPTTGLALRVGTMGVNSTIQIADKLADAMGKTLEHFTSQILML